MGNALDQLYAGKCDECCVGEIALPLSPGFSHSKDRDEERVLTSRLIDFLKRDR